MSRNPIAIDVPSEDGYIILSSQKQAADFSELDTIRIEHYAQGGSFLSGPAADIANALRDLGYKILR
ncbi:hypothetical protein KJ652_01580 [Patescibacteria group bacterium]|nr:hypothetical protein [Patescibacteria group bacterium]MBU1123259.1 hypothetical protein [Patescibacteria group bacterium]